MSSRPGWRQRLAQWIAPKAGRGSRLYAGARRTRTTGGFGGTAGSADAELSTSLPILRQRSRQMVRDSAYAKRAKAIIVNNVIGTGVGLQAQVQTTRNAPAKAVNDAIEWAWYHWTSAGQCHTGGTLSFADLERALMGEVFEAGEVLVRLHRQRFGDSDVPLALEMIEAERLADSIETYGVAPGNELRMGVEVDAQFGRPVAYWLRTRHQGDIRASVGTRTDTVERVPAAEVIHLKLTTRWPQTRGEPWMHAVLRKVDDMDQYSQHEITAARASAAYFATIETPESVNPVVDGEDDDGKQLMDIDPLTIQELRPGEKLAFHTPNRPNSAFDAFMRAMLREVAAGVGTSYESLSRDYSQSNYSSSRLSLLDDRDGYKALQQWWVRSFRMPLHRVWLQQAVLGRAVAGVALDAYGTDPRRYEAVTFKCRGWSWVDPTKEVNAYKEAIRAGLTTVTDVIAATAGGLDVEDVIETRKRELEMFAAAGIEVDTTVEKPTPAPAAAPPVAAAPDDADGAEDADDDDAPAARVMPMRKTA